MLIIALYVVVLKFILIHLPWPTSSLYQWCNTNGLQPPFLLCCLYRTWMIDTYSLIVIPLGGEVDLVNTTKSSIALILDHTPPVGNRTLSTVGRNNHIAQVVLFNSLSKPLIHFMSTNLDTKGRIHPSKTQSNVFLATIIH